MSQSASIAQLSPTPIGSTAIRFNAKDVDWNSEQKNTLIRFNIGLHHFRIKQEKNLLKLYHYCPSLKTRMIKVKIESPTNENSFFIFLNWSVEHLKFIVSFIDSNGIEISSYVGVREPTDLEILVGFDGSVLDYPVTEFQIESAYVYDEFEILMQPPAIGLWDFNFQFLSEILGIESNDDRVNIFILNSSIRTIISSFESYCKARIVEMELEGFSFDYERFSKWNFSKSEIESDFHQEIFKDATSRMKSVILSALGKKRLTVNSIKDANNLFKHLFDLNLYEIGISNTKIEILNKAFKHRHNITHFSPNIAIIYNPNQNDTVVDIEFTMNVLNNFNELIKTIHDATLRCGVRRANIANVANGD